MERKTTTGRNNKVEQLNTLNAKAIAEHKDGVRGFKVDRDGKILYNRPTYQVIIMNKQVMKGMTSGEVTRAIHLLAYVSKIPLFTELPETPANTAQGSVAAAAEDLARNKPGGASLQDKSAVVAVEQGKQATA